MADEDDDIGLRVRPFTFGIRLRTCPSPELTGVNGGKPPHMNGIHGTSRTRRLALLIGMLLHLLGAAAAPFHVWAPADVGSGAVSMAERHDDGSSLPPHDELHCVLCHAAGALALPAAGAELPLAQARARVETPAARHALPFRPSSPARARAPPHA